MTSARLAAIAALFVSSSLVVQATSAAPTTAAPVKGDLWEVTSQMSMEGMPMNMPAQTHKVCTAKEWKEPPGAQDDRHKCQTTEFKTAGAKTSWKVQCDGPPAMTGEGEITRSGPDAYAGLLTFHSPQGVMKMKLDGRRVGDCDLEDNKRQTDQVRAQVEQSQRDAAAMTAQTCKSLVQSMALDQLQAAREVCKDPALKDEFCRRLETQEGFEILAPCRGRQADKLRDAAAYCAKDPVKIQEALCTAALEKETLDFLGSCCPAQAQTIAQRECAGRKFTAMAGSKYQSFCVQYASHTASADTPEPAAQPETTKSKTKKVLKGLFGK